MPRRELALAVAEASPGVVVVGMEHGFVGAWRWAMAGQRGRLGRVWATECDAAVWCVAVLPYRRIALAGSSAGRITAMSVDTGGITREYNGHEEMMVAIQELPHSGGQRFIAACQMVVRVWDVMTGVSREVARPANCVSAMAMVDERTVAVGTRGGEIETYDVGARGRMLRRVTAWSIRYDYQCMCALGGGRLVTGQYEATSVMPGSSMGCVRVWDAADGRCLGIITEHLHACVLRDGRLVVSGWSTRLEVLDGDSLVVLGGLDLAGGGDGSDRSDRRVRHMAVTCDGGHVVVAYRSGAVDVVSVPRTTWWRRRMAMVAWVAIRTADAGPAAGVAVAQPPASALVAGLGVGAWR